MLSSTATNLSYLMNYVVNRRELIILKELEQWFCLTLMVRHDGEVEVTKVKWW